MRSKPFNGQGVGEMPRSCDNCAEYAKDKSGGRFGACDNMAEKLRLDGYPVLTVIVRASQVCPEHEWHDGYNPSRVQAKADAGCTRYHRLREEKF